MPGVGSTTAEATSAEGGPMATFVSLVNFTDQGIRNVKDSPDRLELGVTIKGAYYTLGSFDMVLIGEGTDEAVTTAFLKVGSLGNVRSQTLRAFSADEMKKMVAKMS
jgi:uncharacterized protein with GYD domain